MNHLKQLFETNAEKIALKYVRSTDVVTNIITMHEHNKDIAYEKGFNNGVNINDIEKFAIKYLSENVSEQKEFVENYIKICVDRDNIDDAAIAHAMWLLSNKLNQNN